VYEIELTVPQAGVYYLFYECPSLRVRFHKLPGMILYAEEARPAASATASAGGDSR